MNSLKTQCVRYHRGELSTEDYWTWVEKNGFTYRDHSRESSPILAMEVGRFYARLFLHALAVVAIVSILGTGWSVVP